MEGDCELLWLCLGVDVDLVCDVIDFVVCFFE